MANDEHVALLKEGVDAWNKWRAENPKVNPDLAGANLAEAYLRGANLSLADLSGANLGQAHLGGANLGGANLDGANLEAAYLDGVDLSWANLHWANLSGAILSGANLFDADFDQANLDGADLSDTNLTRAYLEGANLSDVNLERSALRDTSLRDAYLSGCRIYGISAWNLKLDGAKQQSLIITPSGDPEITVDNIEVAQFIYLMLNNQKIRDVIDAITSKAVLILGRFTDERKVVLDALRDELRKRDYLPILFDFEKPRSRDTDETITLLARMAKFVIADVTDAKAVLQELRAFVPDLSSLPVQPIILAAQKEPGMFDFYRNMPWFLPVYRYTDQQQLLADLGERVIRPAELKVSDLRAST